MKESKYSVFATELKVRPDDIDMFNHVHNSKYLDYVLAARHEQMEVNYGMSWNQFIEMGFGWVVNAVQINFKRPLVLGDEMIIKTGILEIFSKGCTVQFEIINKKTQKLCSDGVFHYTLIDLKNNRSAEVTEEMIAMYSK